MALHATDDLETVTVTPARETQAARSAWSNATLLTAIALPLLAIGASVWAAALAYRQGDPALPEAYHWEGSLLDEDFAAIAKAAELRVHANLQIVPDAQLCRIDLQLQAPAPEILQLTLAHGANGALDERVLLRYRDGVYEGPCGPLGASNWQIQLSDPGAKWLLRARYLGMPRQVQLPAASAERRPWRAVAHRSWP